MTPAIEAEMKVLQSLENEITGLQNKQQTLTSQLNENSMVKQEMDLLNSDSKVYKLVPSSSARAHTFASQPWAAKTYCSAIVHIA